MWFFFTLTLVSLAVFRLRSNLKRDPSALLRGRSRNYRSFRIQWSRIARQMVVSRKIFNLIALLFNLYFNDVDSVLSQIQRKLLSTTENTGECNLLVFAIYICLLAHRCILCTYMSVAYDIPFDCVEFWNSITNQPAFIFW